MLELAVSDLADWVTRLLWPLFRIAAFFMAVPLFGTQLLPVRIRLGLALGVTLAVMPGLPPMPAFEGLSLATFVIIAQQMLIGAAMGFMVQLLFQVFVLGGQMISSQMGLGFASISDPTNGVSVVVLSQFYLMLVMLMFLNFNGHLVLIEVIARSFAVLPISAQGIGGASLWSLVMAGGWMFASATLMALPAVIALLVVNFAFGIMTKAAPQLNIFAIGFPFTMLFGLFITWVSLSGFFGQYERFAGEGLAMLSQLLLEGR